MDNDNTKLKAKRQGEELRKYFDSHGMKYRDVAEILGIRPAALSNILAGRDSIGKNRAKKMVEVYGFDYMFLLTGEGELFPPHHTINQNIVAKNGGIVTNTTNENPKNCPSFEELMAKIENMEKLLHDKDNEVHFLRDMIRRLVPGAETANDKQ